MNKNKSLIIFIVSIILSLIIIALGLLNSLVANKIIAVLSIIMIGITIFQYIAAQPFTMILEIKDWAKKGNEYEILIPKSQHKKNPPKVSVYTRGENGIWQECISPISETNGNVIVGCGSPHPAKIIII